MLDPKIFDDIAKRLGDAVPAELKHIQAELQKNFRNILQSTFEKLDLVTREEFDAQVKVLNRTRKKIDKLEKEIAASQTKKKKD